MKNSDKTGWSTIDSAVSVCSSTSSSVRDKAVLDAVRELKHKATVRLISERVDCSERSTVSSIERLRSAGYSIEIAPQDVVLAGAPDRKRDAIVHKLTDLTGDWAQFGAVGDNHLCNRHERLDVLNAAYDLFQAEGISTVYNTGNWIDGEFRFNRHELKVFGMDNQIDYWIDNYPQRKGVTTHFIAGDDHEGWYQQRECVEIGRYAMLRAQAAGRDDLKYLGYIEADIDLKIGKSSSSSIHMKVIHPGGGSAYAVSYTGQKLAESFQGGEKPGLVLQGHFHKFNLGYPREVWVFDTGTTCDQTGFMRKKRIQAMVGYGIVAIHAHPRGGINRIRGEFIPYYDRGFYGKSKRVFS